MRIVISIVISALLLIAIPASTLADEQVPMAAITGRIIDFSRHPVSGVQVRLSDEKGASLQNGQSDRSGSFELKHKICQTCTLEIIPDAKSGLASALVENIPGGVERHFLLTLQKGFLIRGRIVNQGHGLKGLEVKVSAADSAQDGHHVDAGGSARSSHDGWFEMTLTPGRKKLSIVNTRYANLVNHYEQDFTVTADEELPVISLPTAH